MERRNDIRAAMQNLLASAKRPEGLAAPAPVLDFRPAMTPPDPISETERRILTEIQESLQQHGIKAEPMELRSAIMAEVFARPALCRGMVAAFLLGDG